MEDRCFWSVASTNAARYQMTPVCSKRRGPEANRTNRTHCNSPVTSPDPGHIARTYDNTDANRILSTLPPEDWRRPRGSPASHGWAPYSRIWDLTISHCLMQWIWPRTGLCGGCGRCMALRNLELQARNYEDWHMANKGVLLFPSCHHALLKPVLMERLHGTQNSMVIIHNQQTGDIPLKLRRYRTVCHSR